MPDFRHSIPCWIAFAFLLVQTSLAAQVFPGKEWTFQEAPEEEGWNQEKGEQFRRFLVDSTVITGLMVVHKGQVVFEYGDLKENSYIASCRKSVLAMLYGKYVQKGIIDLNKTIGEMGLIDVSGILPEEQKASVQDLISARSGVYHPEGYPGGWQEYAPERGTVTPGSYWLYNNWDFNAAGYIFETETQKDIYDEVELQLAKPLDMQDWDRSLQKKEGNMKISRYLAYPMWFSTRDMARIGLLMLNRGKWKKRQLIDEDWIDEMLKQRTSSEEVNANAPVFRKTGYHFGYGYMWWLWEKEEDPRLKDAYAALGAMGQSITVYPSIDVVVAYKTKAAYRRVNSFPARLKTLRMAVEMLDVD